MPFVPRALNNPTLCCVHWINFVTDGMAREWKPGSLTLGALTILAVIGIAAEQMRCEKRFDPEQITFGPVGQTEPNISPDGRWIAYQYFAERSPRLATIGIMDALKGFQSARPLVDQHGYAAEMSWSPDSKCVSFISSEDGPGRNTDQIYKVNVITKEIVQITGRVAQALLILLSLTMARVPHPSSEASF